MLKDSKIFVAWSRWMVWSAIVRNLQKLWYTNIITKSRQELDLTDINQVKDFFENNKPEYIFLAAAKVWWILANNEYPAEFIYQNLQIQNNIIHCSWQFWATKLLFLWSSCIYPKESEQPIKEEYLLTWKLEPTNEPYAIAKIAWIKMCQSYNRQYWTNFIACMPTNLYWEWDNFDLQSSHVIPWIIRKFHEAKLENKSEVTLRWDWTPMREFLYVDDMANACIEMMINYSPTPEQNEKWEIFMNIGTWKDVTIKELSEFVKKIVWFTWNIIWDTTKPNWTMRKLLNIDKITNLWWTPKISLEEWLSKTYMEFLKTL